MAVGRQVGDPSVPRRRGRRELQPLAAQHDLSGAGFEAGERAQELRLAVAGDPGQPDDLSRGDVEVDRMEGVVE